jgi:hypothetical protein
MDHHPNIGGGDCLLHSVIQGLRLHATLHHPLTLQIPQLRRNIHTHMTRTASGKASAERNAATIEDINLILPRPAGTPQEWLEMWAVEALQVILRINIHVHYLRRTGPTYSYNTHWFNSDPSRLTLHVLHSGNDHFEYLHPRQHHRQPP